jgi:Flp pilus assembly protein TadD
MFARQGDLRQAIQIYRKALRLKPDHAETRRNHDRAVSLLNAE